MKVDADVIQQQRAPMWGRAFSPPPALSRRFFGFNPAPMSRAPRAVTHVLLLRRDGKEHAKWH